MPKISVIIPVYKAENYLRKCVESIVLGEKQDLEVILVEDCSPDKSWELCQQLAAQYPQIKCLRNEHNSGVSYTRNRGLDVATGQYLLFVDSDDWVSGSYAKTLLETQEANPGKLVVCAFTFIDHVSRLRRKYDLEDASTIAQRDFLKLVDAVLLQQLWNKVFPADVIRNAGIRFDETISMGEDYQFVMDVIEASKYSECVIIHQPLYYYIRWNNNSLMSTWSAGRNFERELVRLERMSKLCGLQTPEAYRVEQLKTQYVYSITQDRSLSKQEKLVKVQKIMDGATKLGLNQNKYKRYLIEKINRLRGNTQRFQERVHNKTQAWKNGRRIAANRKNLHKDGFTIISQNCIGGVFSHDMGLEFRSPTVNLFIPAADFIKFVNNLEHYLAAELELHWGEEYPLGKVDDVELHFVHYETCQQASEAWERRKKRVDLSKVLVLSTDRDGFDEAVFEQWKTISYPKLLFTARKEYADHPDALYFPKYEEFGCVPDLIPKREFYKGHMLCQKANEAGSGR